MAAFTSTPTIQLTSFFGWNLCPSVTDVRPIARCATRAPRAQLIGIPDHLRENIDPSPHEVLLAELRYTDPARLPALIESSLDMLDEDFYKFLEQKINESADLEERESLRALRDAITSLMGQMLDAMSAQTKTAAQEGGKEGPKSTPEDVANASYDELIDSFIKSYEGASNDTERIEAIRTSVDLNYHRIDLRMLERLSERIVSAGERAPILACVRDTISDTMNERVTLAMHRLKSVLSAGSSSNMRAAIDKLARQGGIDDAFILLLQANLDEARKAGATGAIDALSGILKHASQAQDMTVAPEIQLIRSLLRMNDSAARTALLMQSFEAGGAVMLPDGSRTEGQRVDGKKFVDALRKLIQEFGNVDEQFVLKLSKIGEESEAVARKIYDMEGKDVQELQEEAFHKRSVSVWDLEEYEHRETGEGRTAPWEGQLGSIPEKMGFGPDGKLSV